jgi:hypothetical protein
VSEKEDLSLIGEWRNNPEFQGEYNLLIQEPKEELEKRYYNFHQDTKWFMIEKKDGAKIGLIVFELEGGVQEIGYGIIPVRDRRATAPKPSESPWITFSSQNL